MEEWKEYKIGDLFSHFKSGKGIKADEIYSSGKYPVFGGNGLRGYTNQNNFNGDCAIIGRQGAFCGNVRYFKGKAYMTEHAIVAVANENNNTRFLAYLLSLMKLGRFSGQSAQPGLSVTELTKQPIVVPSLSTQKRIASILSSLDDKIELNRRINENLEQQAQALFKSWFVDFEPFKDGKFVDSELGRIPEGWNADNIYEYIDVIYGAPYKSSLFNTDKNGYPLIRIRDLRTFNPQFYTSEILPNTEYIYPGDVVAGMDAEFIPTLWLGEKGILNQRCCKFVPKRKNISNYYILYLLMPELLYVQNYKTGTTVSHLGKADIDRIKVITPPIEIIEKFSTMVNPLFSKKIKTACENRILIQLRDTLLPRLMSGELAITDVNSRILRNK